MHIYLNVINLVFTTEYHQIIARLISKASLFKIPPYSLIIVTVIFWRRFFLIPDQASWVLILYFKWLWNKLLDNYTYYHYSNVYLFYSWNCINIQFMLLLNLNFVFLSHFLELDVILYLVFLPLHDFCLPLNHASNLM